MKPSTRVVVYAALFAGISGAILLIPVGADAFSAYRDAKKREETRRYATGLYPCHSYWRDFSDYIDSHLPDLPDVSIDVYPSFSNPEALRIVGEDIYYFRVNSGNVTAFTIERAKIVRGRLTAQLSDQFTSMLTNEINNSHGIRQHVLDGVTYVFRTGRTNRCAEAVSSGLDARAGKISEIYHSSINYIVRNPEFPVSQRDLEKKIEALNSL